MPIQLLCDEAKADSAPNTEYELKPIDKPKLELNVNSDEANPIQTMCFQYLARVRKDSALQYGLAGAAVGVLGTDVASGGRLLSSIATGFGMSVGAATGAAASYATYNYYRGLKI